MLTKKGISTITIWTTALIHLWPTAGLIDFKGMLENGFKIGNAEVESPKSIQTATAQISQSLPTLLLASTGVVQLTVSMKFWRRTQRRITKNTSKMRKNGSYLTNGKITAWKKTQKDIYDAMQSLEYEINTLFTSNGQNAFLLR